MGGLKYADEAAEMTKSAIKHGKKNVDKNIFDIKYPGDNPNKAPSEGFEWRGKSSPDEGKGNWYNPKTQEKWNADLEHREPIGPHWDYTDANGNHFRVYPDGTIEQK